MTQRTLQAIRHIGFEDLGSFAAPLKETGYDIEYIDVAECDLTTLDPLGADLLVVLGGPIGVYDHDALMSIVNALGTKKLPLSRTGLS